MMDFEFRGNTYGTKLELTRGGCEGCAFHHNSNLCNAVREDGNDCGGLIFIKKLTPPEIEAPAEILAELGSFKFEGKVYEERPETDGCEGCAFHYEIDDAIRESTELVCEILEEARKRDAGKPIFDPRADLIRRSADEKPTNPKDAIATFKLPLHLVSPIVKAYQAIAHYLGNVKYGAWNCRAAGVRASVYKSAFERHVDAWWEGEKYDPVDGTPHLANAQACLNILIDAEETGVLTDDRPPSRKEALARVRAEMEALMPQIAKRYEGKNPRHFTIADSEAKP